jgi:hypothetical protein
VRNYSRIPNCSAGSVVVWEVGSIASPVGTVLSVGRHCLLLPLRIAGCL